MSPLKYLILLAFSATTISGWTGNIVFEDNFDGNSLNLNKWEIQEGCDNRKCI